MEFGKGEFEGWKGKGGGLMLLMKEADNKDVDEKTEKKENEG